MAYINIALTFFSLLGYSGFVLKRERSFFAPLIIVSMIVSVIYVFGIIGHLSLGYYMSLFLGWALLIRSIYIKEFFEIKYKAFDFLLFTVCALPFVVYFLSTPSDFQFTKWDEFSFWAISVKYMLPLNALNNEDSGIGFTAYPPAQQLFQYFVLKSLEWKEGYIILAQIFFVLSGLLFTVGRIINNKLAASISFVTSISLLYFFGYDLSNIYSDPLLAVYFSATISWALACNDSKKDLLVFSLLLFTLVIIKQVGLLLSLIALTIYIASKLNISNFVCSFKRVAINTFLLLMPVILSYGSWSFYVKSIGGSVKTGNVDFIQTFSSPFLERLGATIIKFHSDIMYKGYIQTSINITTASLMDVIYVVAILLCSASLISWKENGASKLMVSLGLITGFAIYNLFLLYCYIFIFSEYEGRALASFLRYSSAYSLAVLLVAVCMLIDSVENVNKITPVFLSVIALGLALYFTPPKFFSDARGIIPPDAELQVRYKTKALSDKIKNDAHGKDVKSYFISQGSSGFEKYIFNYEMMPLKSLWWCWSIGKPYHSNDVWTCDKPLVELTKDYQYIAIYNGDKQFWDLARKYLSHGSNELSFGVYRIDLTNGFSLIEIK